MDSNSEDGDYQILDQDGSHYKVIYRNAKGVDYFKKEDSTKKRLPGSQPSNSPSRVKRVVSCKRKTHHLTAARRKLPGSRKTHFTSNNQENVIRGKPDMDPEIFAMDPWDLSHVDDEPITGGTGPEQSDYSMLSEITRDHSPMTNVLFGRNLRLKVAFTLWQRNVGELLTYFLRIQDSGVFVDFLPVISKSITKDFPAVSIGCCVDLFPLVKKVLSNPYEEHVIVVLKWIHSVLKKWWEELRESGLRGTPKASLDKNFQIFNQLLLELWHQEPLLKSVPGSAGDLAKVIDSFILQL